MPHFNARFAEILDGVRRAGDFYTSGKIEFLAPQVEVEGVGVVALPLLPLQAEQLIAVAEQAPYGRGMETLVDTGVRRTWQLHAHQVHIHGRHWDQTLNAILGQVNQGLGVGGEISAEFYKCLIYGEGNFFLSHRDTEKTDGMFATLVMVLPSLHQGGELVVRHTDRQVELDLGGTDPSEIAFAAFYADCRHEVRPVTSGFRLALIYNLKFADSAYPPRPPGYPEEEERMTTLLQEWVADSRNGDESWPEKLVYPLDHAYTEAGVSFASLKGEDAARAAVLVAAARQSECELHLALLSIEESGSAEYSSDSQPRRYRYEYDDPDLEVGEVYDRRMALTDWRHPEGQAVGLGELPFLDEELSPEDVFQDVDPEELEFEEASGNEGPSFERLYQRAALVLWPKDRRLAVICQGGLAATLPLLKQRTDEWVFLGESCDLPQWQEAHELAWAMIVSWPETKSRLDSSKTSSEATFLSLLAKFKDQENGAAFLTMKTARGLYHAEDNQAILEVLELLPPQQMAEFLQQLITGNSRNHFPGCTRLLCMAMDAWHETQGMDFMPVATALMDALPNDEAPPASFSWDRPNLGLECIVDLLRVLSRLDFEPFQYVSDHILSNQKTYSIDEVLVPALLALGEKNDVIGLGIFQHLRRACLGYLQTRIAEPLAPPGDWTRASTLSCHCAQCMELAHFLADPTQRIWTFKAAEAKRSHVASIIVKNNCDVDCMTDRKGRPYALECTKNQAHYEKRMQQRQKDLAALAQLDLQESK